MRSVPFSPERRCTIRITFTFGSWTPNIVDRTVSRSFGSPGVVLNTSCVPDGTRRSLSSRAVPRWSFAKHSVGAEFNVPHRIAGHLHKRSYKNKPKLQTGANGTCFLANIDISTWCEQYTGMPL